MGPIITNDMVGQMITYDIDRSILAFCKSPDVWLYFIMTERAILFTVLV